MANTRWQFRVLVCKGGKMKRLLLTVMTALLLSVSTTWADTAAAYTQDDYSNALRSGDYANALRILQSLAGQEDATAQYNLGVMYKKGLGVAQNDAEAVKWWRLAAAQGVAAAQYNLALTYEKGQGTAQDYVRAYMWFNLGAVSGDAGAAKSRDIVAKVMTPQQIAQAQKMARDCQRRNFKGCS